VPVELDLSAELTRERDRSRPCRAIFRDFELRDPLRRLEEALDAAESAAIPRPEAESARVVAVRNGAASDLARLTGAELALVCHGARDAQRRAAPAPERLALRRLRRRAACARGEVGNPAELVAARATGR
jgi:DNA polymerase-1